MVDKNNLKKFLKSGYSEAIKIFVLAVLARSVDSPMDSFQYALYIYDLDLYDEGFINLPDGEYHLIDFDYLQELSPKVRDFYLAILTNGMMSNDITNLIGRTTLLVEHGILISNIEYLKIKRKRKLEEVARNKSYNYNNDDVDDFFDLG